MESPIPEEKIGIYELFIKHKSGLEFICGCGKRILTKKNDNWIHILRHHGEIIPRNSSHILLQKSGNRKFCHIKVDSPEPGRLFFCPCRPDVVMDKEKFVKHIISIHKGISPVYKKEHFQRPSWFFVKYDLRVERALLLYLFWKLNLISAWSSRETM